MSTRRPYNASVRFHGRTGVFPTRPVSFASRERVMERAQALLAQSIDSGRAYAEEYGRPFDPSRYDVIVFGPDPDLRTGRIILADGTERDLMETVTEALEKARQSLLAAGWTDEEISRGERARR